MTYKTLVLTGLRKGELATLTVGQLDLDADPPYLTLDAADEKNREGSTIAIRPDLAADLSGIPPGCTNLEPPRNRWPALRLTTS